MKKIAQYKGKANEEFWYSTFKDYNITEKVQKTRSSRLFKILKENLSKKDKIIEGGSGMGKITISLIEEGYNTLGVDYSKNLINKIKKEMPSYRNNFFEMDVRNLKFRENNFDAYISPGVIEHFYDDETQNKILNEAKRVLKTNGKMICIVPYLNIVKIVKYKSLQKKYNKLKKEGIEFYQYVYTKKEIISILEKNGFKYKKYELLGLHDTKILGKNIIPPSLYNNKLLLQLFGTTICIICEKI